MDEFGTWLKSELERRGMTAKELARQAKVTARSVYHYIEGDRSPSVELASWLLEALGKRFEIVDKGDRMKPRRAIPAADHDTPDGSWWYVCPGCRCAIDYHDRFCRHCGQALYWEGI